MNTLTKLTGILGLAAALAYAPTAPAAAPDQMDAIATLDTGKPVFAASESVIVNLTLTNPNPQPLKILAYQVPAGELTAPLFQVTVDGAAAPYLGMLVKRAPLAAKDYLTLAAGESRQFSVDLTRYYSFARAGNYQISYQAQSGELYAADGNTRAAGKLQSNELSLRAGGRADKALPTWVPDVVSGPSTFTGCTAERQNLLTIARNDASTYANESAGYFSANRNGARYVKWFGTFVPDRWNVVKSHFDLIREAVDTARVDFDCNCTIQNPESVFAYVFPSQPYRIHLCGQFWLTTATGTDSRAGTLIHEMSHFTVLGGTSDLAYGQTAAMALAVSNPNNAIMNADSHEYFAENTPATPDDSGGPVVITPLTNGVPVSGLSGALASETRFSISVPAGASNLSIRMSGGSGDPDLFVRLGASPTRDVFDCKSDVVGPADQCLIAQPVAGTYQILIYGFSEYAGLTLTASYSSGSPTLAVSAAGTGSGVVTSSPAGINCGSACSATFAAGTQVTLTATGSSGSSFSGWSGDCSGTQRTCTLTLGAARSATAIFSPGAVGTAVDEPALVRFALPTPNPANANCPAGFFIASANDGPGAGVAPGTWGMEILLDAPGSRELAGGLNFGGLIDVGQVGFAGFTIANAANESQTVNLNLSGSPADNANGSLPVRVRIGRIPDANTNITVFETTTTISLASPYVSSLPLQPGFYAVTVAPAAGTAGGAAEGQFFFSMTTSFIGRPGGGFQGGAVVGGYHNVHPFGGVSGFVGFCLGTQHSTSIRLLSQPSYGAAGARDLRLRVLDAQQRELAIVPGS